jgi:hypothetical protein
MWHLEGINASLGCPLRPSGKDLRIESTLGLQRGTVRPEFDPKCRPLVENRIGAYLDRYDGVVGPGSDAPFSRTNLSRHQNGRA